MAINFPSSPTVGQTFTVGNVIYTWDGSKWYTNLATATVVESDPIYTASTWYTTTNNSENWNTAYGWGNHASVGYLTSAAIGTTVQAYDADLTSWAAISPSSKQDTLVSGVNIKTINATSVLGSGDIAIFAGGLIKVEVVTSLPVSPDPNTLYIVTG